MLFGVAALIVAVVRCEQVGGLSAGLAAIGKDPGAEPDPHGSRRAVGHGADDLLRHLGAAPDGT